MRFFLVFTASLISSALANFIPEKGITLERRVVSNVDNKTALDADIGTTGSFNATSYVQDCIKDIAARSQYTQDLVLRMNSTYPGYNWIACHSKHTYKFDGTVGVSWGHRHSDFETKAGGISGYEVYNFKTGEFTLQGDGGYVNFAYIGNVIKSDQGGNHLIFGLP
ncbi:hypothetical protein ONZ45_g3105 [Pleurotus djamor]|nr:hypothetical protein ONZ45_g3105 [Pleurotus djamor]